MKQYDNHIPSPKGLPGENTDSQDLETVMTEIINAVRPLRKRPLDFKKRDGYSWSFLHNCEDRLSLKEADQDEEDRHAKVLECIITYICNNQELFSTDAYAEPGNAYDDQFFGADVVMGLPGGRGEPDTVFSLDASSAISPDSVSHKFETSRYFDAKYHPERPKTSKLNFFHHDERYERISSLPNYIVGARVATIIDSAKHFKIEPGGIIHHERDPVLQEMLLIEVILQAETGIYACDNVPAENKNEITAKTRKDHLKVYNACRATLAQRWKTDIQTREGRQTFYKHLYDSYIEYSKKDDTFRSITSIASKERTAQLTRLRKRRAAQSQKNVAS